MGAIPAVLICTVVRVRARHMACLELDTQEKLFPQAFTTLQSYVRVSLLLLAQAVSSSWNSFSPLFAPIKIQEEETSSGGMLFLPN